MIASGCIYQCLMRRIIGGAAFLVVILEAYILVIILSVSANAILYCSYPQLIQHSREYKVFLLAGMSAIVLECAAFIASLLPSYLWFYLVQLKVYTILLAIPFYYWATRYWTEMASSASNMLKFLGIQFAGLSFGFGLGFAIYTSRWNDASILFAYYTSLTGWIRYIIPEFF